MESCLNVLFMSFLMASVKSEHFLFQKKEGLSIGFNWKPVGIT